MKYLELLGINLLGFTFYHLFLRERWVRFVDKILSKR